jgi:transcriptional regulator with XRE-family HTH domain
VPNLNRARQAPTLVALGKAIAKERKRLGLSQEALALAADVDRSYLGRVERGDNNVAMLILAKIARGLGTSIARLCDAAEI